MPVDVTQVCPSSVMSSVSLTFGPVPPLHVPGTVVVAGEQSLVWDPLAHQYGRNWEVQGDGPHSMHVRVEPPDRPMAQPPKLEVLPWWFWLPACLLALGQMVLVNLFFAALARKMLR